MDPNILDAEVKLVVAPDEWVPASIRFSAGVNIILLESNDSEVRHLRSEEVLIGRLLKTIDPETEHSHMGLLKWAIEAGFPFGAEPLASTISNNEDSRYWKVVWMLSGQDRFKKGSKDGHEERQGYSKVDAEKRAEYLKNNHGSGFDYYFLVEPDSFFERDFLRNKCR